MTAGAKLQSACQRNAHPCLEWIRKITDLKMDLLERNATDQKSRSGSSQRNAPLIYLSQSHPQDLLLDDFRKPRRSLTSFPLFLLPPFVAKTKVSLGTRLVVLPPAILKHREDPGDELSNKQFREVEGSKLDLFVNVRFLFIAKFS